MLGRLGVDRSVSHSVLHLSTSVVYPASDGSRYISAPNPLPTVLRLDSLSRVKASSPPAAVASEMLTKFCRSLTSEEEEREEEEEEEEEEESVSRDGAHT